MRMFMLSRNVWAVAYPNTRTNKPGCGCICYNPLILQLATLTTRSISWFHLNQLTAHDRANLRHKVPVDTHTFESCCSPHKLPLSLSLLPPLLIGGRLLEGRKGRFSGWNQRLPFCRSGNTGSDSCGAGGTCEYVCMCICVDEIWEWSFNHTYMSHMAVYFLV